MKLTSLITIGLSMLVALGVNAAIASDPFSEISLGQPELGVAVAVDKSTIEVRRYEWKLMHQASSPRRLDKDRKAVVPQVYVRVERIDASRVSGRRLNGKELELKDLLRELSKAKAVVLQMQGVKPDPAFMGVFRPETLLLHLPESTELLSSSGSPFELSRPSPTSPDVPATTFPSSRALGDPPTNKLKPIPLDE